jgi:hypothetical protein
VDIVANVTGQQWTSQETGKRAGLHRIAGWRVAVAVPLVLLLSCRGDGPQARGRPSASESARPTRLPTVGDLLAYGRGLTREVALARSAVAALNRLCTGDERALVVLGSAPDHLEAEGSVAADRSPAQFRSLVAQVDSLLIAGALTGDSSWARALGPEAPPLPRLAVRLDSLRVERAVLRSTLGALTSADGPRPSRRCGA